MQYRFNRNIRRLFPDILERKGVSVVLAVSGGADSMAMAELALGCPLLRTLAVLHCNFHLRGEESDADEAYVRGWAASRGVPFESVDFSTEQYASDKGISVEMAARELRYGWFASAVDKYGADYVAVAHNLNDNVETLFLNLLRGTGVRGLSGMKPVSGRVLRPMLCFTREQIEDFAGQRNIAYRTDSTNADTAYKRNRIRNEVFPILAKINPSFLRTISGNMGYLSELSDMVDGLADGLDTGRGSVPVTVDFSSVAGTGMPRNMLHRLLSAYGFGASQVSGIYAGLVSEGERTVSGNMFFSATHLAVTDRSRILVYPLELVPEDMGGRLAPVSESIVRDSLEDGGTVLEFCGKRYSLRIVPAGSVSYAPGRLCLDADRLSFPVEARQWRTSDRMKPFGMKGSRKLSDMFSDAKMDVVSKHLLPVFVCADGSVAAAGLLRSSESFRVTDRTSRVLVIEEA